MLPMLTIGIDAHKHQFSVAVVDATGRVLRCSAWRRDALTVDEALALVAGGRAERHWGIEGTGTFGRQLAQALVQRGEVVFEVPGSSTARERRRSRGRAAEKSDATDAVAVARVVLRDREQLPRVVRDGVSTQLRLLTEHRQNLIQERSRLLNQLYAHVDGAGVEIRPLFRCRNNRRHLRAMAELSCTGLSPLDQARGEILRQLATLVLALDRAIADLTKQLEQLAPRVAPHLLRIPGCAALTATKIVAEAGSPARFASAARFGAYAGVAPLEASSGANRRHRLSRRGNRQLNCALHVIAVTQRRWHKIGQDYLARKVAEGKTRKEALRSLKRQLANVVLRALQQDAPLVESAVMIQPT